MLNFNLKLGKPLSFPNFKFLYWIKCPFLILLPIIVFGSCKGHDNEKDSSSCKNQEPISKTQSEYITLIFKQIPREKFISSKQNEILGGRAYLKEVASYRDNNGITWFINPTREPDSDTVFLPVENKNIEIYFNHIGLEGSSYLFKSEDKISIIYKNGRPHINILNRPTKFYDYRFEELVHTPINNKRITPFENFFRYLPFPDKQLSKKEYTKFFENHLERGSTLLLKSLINKKKVLDSLYHNKLLSKNIYEYYNEKLKYINWSRLAKLKKLYTDDKKIEEGVNNEDFTNGTKLLFGNNRTKEEDLTIQKIIKSEDRFLTYKYYQDFLCDFYLPNYFEEQTPRHTYYYGNFGGNYREWGDVFDTIENSKLFPNKVKKFLLYKYMNKIAEDLSPGVVQKYYQKFSKIPNNENYIALLNNRYNIDSTLTSKLILKDKFNNTYYLEDILENNNDKTILINFWASWCAPCIKVIPEWNKLQKNYASEDMLFISIAHEQDYKRWKNSESLKLFNDLSHNYILRNPYLSNFVKDNHINFVPRYILFHKGKMVNANAKGPRNEETKLLLEKYLSE